METKARREPCKGNHTPNQPDGYLQWHEWAEKMLETHQQERCPECGLYEIWVEVKELSR